MFQLMREKESHPWVRQAVELFGAEVIRVDVPRSAAGEVRAAGVETTTEGSH
jgi:hypothetical protein